MGRPPDAADEAASQGQTLSSADPSGGPPLDEGRFLPGTVLAGRYRVVALLGQGGMGEVYRADDLRLRQTVALKLLPRQLSADAGALARLHNEVRLARQVSHPNVCRVHDVGEADGLTFLTMEYVDGEDLRSLLRRIGRLPAEHAALVARQICAGLGAAHERGVLHRDLKPANVMIDGRGRARLTDFGLAVAAGDLAAGRERAGTPAYMAPEQLEGGRVSERTDLYALGLVLYEMYTGRRAFEAESLPRLLEKRRLSPEPPTRHLPDLDPRIERTILQCLDADSTRRPPSAAAVAAALSGPDALAAAVAAGETPSPEMVAAADVSAALRPGVAVAVAALALALPLLGFRLLDEVVIVNRVPFERTPEALAERARSILERVGVGTASPDLAYGFAYDRRYIQWVRQHDRSPDRWQKLSSGQPAAVHFWYRQSSRSMSAYNDAGIVTLRDPPLEPGMALVRLDTRGRLLELLAPADRAPGREAPRAAGWEGLFADAGLDPAALRSTPESATPPVFADSVAGFDGAFPEQPAVALHVDAAALAGRPVAFRVRGPWETGGPAVRSQATVLMTAGFAVIVPMLVLGGVVARRNLRLGRGDRRSAFRLATLALVCDLVAAPLLYGQPRSAIGAWQMLGRAAGEALFDATAVWLLYVALEPYVRRRWPEGLVAWTRLLSGRFNDPLIGRDVLLAALAASSVPCLWGLMLQAPAWRGDPAAGLAPEAYLGFLAGPSHLLSWLISFVCVQGLIYGLVNVLLFVLMRSWLRRTAVAAGAAWLVWTAAFGVALPQLTGGRLSPEQILVLGALTAIPVVLLVRRGLLAIAVYAVISIALLESSAVVQLGSWHARPAAFLCCLVVCAIGWGLYASLAARPFRWDTLLEE